MTEFVFSPYPQASVAVKGSDSRFPVRRIFCVGRNYAAHAREMGQDPERELPFFFSKPADAVVETGTTIPYPPETSNLHYEIELVIYLGQGGQNIAQDKVREHLWGAGVGIDLTRRDLQLAAREKGRPWDFGKAFDRSAPLNAITPIDQVASLEKGRIWLAVNGEMKQDADIGELIWSVDEVVSILSHSMRLEAGDVIMTGTPAGVGQIVPGDAVTGGVEGLGEISLKIGDPAA